MDWVVRRFKTSKLSSKIIKLCLTLIFMFPKFSWLEFTKEIFNSAVLSWILKVNSISLWRACQENYKWKEWQRISTVTTSWIWTSLTFFQLLRRSNFQSPASSPTKIWVSLTKFLINNFITFREKFSDQFANEFVNQNWRNFYDQTIPEVKRQLEPILSNI